MGLFSFLGTMALMDESSKKFGTVPTILGAMVVDDLLQEEQNDYWNKVNDFWQDIQNNDFLLISGITFYIRLFKNLLMNASLSKK